MAPLSTMMAKVNPGWVFSFLHHQLGGAVDLVVRSVPDHDHSVDAAADHVRDLPLDLGRIGRTVTDVDVAGLAEPEHQMSEDLGLGPGVEQGVNVQLAYVGCAQVSV